MASGCTSWHLGVISGRFSDSRWWWIDLLTRLDGIFLASILDHNKIGWETDLLHRLQQMGGQLAVGWR